MSKLFASFGTDCLSLPATDGSGKRNAQGLSTADIRRLLTELRLHPPAQRIFLRKLLRRALATGAPTQFPVLSRVVPDLASPS
jgi:hypothetical protein